MPPSLTSLPTEIQLTIFCVVDDLDDALYFSQTCKTFQSLFATHKKTIERQIINSSPVYEYDLILSRYLSIKQDLARIYLSTGNGLLEEQRPKEAILIHCMNVEWAKEKFTDEVIGDIALRWKQLRYLRELYLDDSVFSEFELFRARFVSRLSIKARAAIVEPGLVKSSSHSSRLERSRNVNGDFRERFHTSLCLQSMAIATRDLGRISINEEITMPEHPRDLSDDTINPIISLWAKDSVVVGGEKRLLSASTKFDCLELFDFIYLFLLRKVLPFSEYQSWTEMDADVWPFDYWGSTGELLPEDHIESWDSFLYHARWTLQPTDLVDLIKHRAWSSEAVYPADKSLYMRARGIFDMGPHNDMDWYSSFERSSMVSSLFDDGLYILDTEMTTSEDPCWWDQARLNAGSPFESGFQSKYLAELPKIQNSHVGRQRSRSSSTSNSDLCSSSSE